MKLHVVTVFLSLVLHLHGAVLASEIRYTLITANSPDCNSSLADYYPVSVLGDFNSTGEWTELNPQLDGECGLSNGSTTQANGQIRLRCFRLPIPQRTALTANNLSNCIQLRFVQKEHRGGLCDCWAVVGMHTRNGRVKVQSGYQNNLSVFETLPGGIDIPFNNYTGFCLGSASVPRELILSTKVNASHDGGDVSDSCLNTDLGDEKSALKIFQEKNYSAHSQLDTMFVNFDLQLGYQNSLDSFDEGVEFAVRLCTSFAECHDWIPIRFYTNDTTRRNNLIHIGDYNSHDEVIMLRGYNVTTELYGDHKFHEVQLTLCSDSIAQSDYIQFRWLQTVRLNQEGADQVNLDNVNITFNSALEGGRVLLEDDFNDQTALNYSKWSTHTRRVSLINASVQFGGLITNESFKPLGNNATILSREISTVKLRLTPSMVTTTSTPPTTKSTPPSEAEREVLESIKGNEQLSNIYNQIGDCPICALYGLNEEVRGSVGSESPDSSSDLIIAATYLLSGINSNLGNDAVNLSVSEVFLSVADNLTVASQGNNASPTKDSVLAGSTLLKVLDDFALNNHDGSRSVPTDNIELRVMARKQKSDAPIEETFEGAADISIPGDVVGGGNQKVRMASFLFRNLSGLLPDSLNGTSSDDDNATEILRLASPVISATFQCDNCTTSNLSTPVNITFTLTPYDQVLLENDPNGLVKCVFWQFDKTNSSSAVLFPGRWSQEGCNAEPEIKSGKAVCRCNHLTHFAILLSARPLDLSPSHTLALETIGYIGVTVSLIAMALTIMVFIFLNRSTNRPLQKIRNYIHIQLCVTLGISQIIFVAGIKPDFDSGQLVGGVPLGCRLVAVLLHYWFLVSFMWMLMEGVVLYVALILVFVKHHGRYIAAFTIISYGVPLLYVGALTVPLGFARNEEMRRNHTYDYGYEQACYLNPENSFIWSLIAPVLLIFVANIGFFIMAIVIMYKHHKRQTTKSRATSVKQWLKACISLSVVMGITWIIGILVIEVEELFVLAYIFTIFVAFQGLFIFITFVLISESKRVKELYRKWWKGKVAESDFLSKHFGEKTLTSALNSQHYITEMSTVPCEKGLLAPKQVIDMEEGSSDNLGSYFDVTFVPTLTPASPAKEANEDEEKKLSDLQDTVASDEMKRLSSVSSTCSSQPLSSSVWPLNSLANGETPIADMNCKASTTRQ